MEAEPNHPRTRTFGCWMAAGLGLSLIVGPCLFFLLQSQQENATTVITAAGRMAAAANGQFAVDLYRQVAKESAGKNVFLSPYSIATSLTVATEGAVDETRDEMIQALRIPTDSFQQIHVGQKELQDSLVPVLPAELFSQITALRARLKAANERTVSLGKSVEANNQDLKPVFKSMREAQELAKEINTLNKTVSTYELRVANSIWMDTSYPYDPQFLSAIESNYGSVLLHADFRRLPEDACQSINQWIDENTNHQIPKILPPESLDESTRLLIINAVYFKGAWAEPFREEFTKIEPFRISDESSVDVAMMHQWNDSTVSYAAFTEVGDLFPCPPEVNAELKDDDPSLYPDKNGFKMLALDYQGQRLQLIILLPQSTTGLERLEEMLTHESLEKWLTKLERRTVNLSIPRFKFDSNYSLATALRSLGISRAFENDAEFDRLTTSNQISDRLRINR